jgi:GAF domain-containing protein
MSAPELKDFDREAGRLVAQAASMLDGQHDLVANAAMLSSLLYHSLDEVNWAGFYFLKGDQLVVGPFQGLPACVSIPMGQGVCGAAAETRRVVRVADVHSFEGHIACDAASRSEIVLPLISDGKLIGVLDLDSPVKNRFGEDDERLLKKIASLFVNSLARA